MTVGDRPKESAVRGQRPGVRGPLLVGLVLLGLYLLTMTPAVGLIDSGELAAGCRMLGVLHPTGYPLYTMLGRLASLVPAGTVLGRVAFLSALLAAVGAGLAWVLARRVAGEATSAGVAAAVVGLSLPVWSVATDAEVHALTLVLVVLVWYAASRAREGRWLLLWAYLSGLALCNHMSALSAVLGAWLAVALELRRDMLRRLPALLALGLLGLSCYAFLVLRARAGPLFAWGNPVDLERLLWHVTGRQYQVWMFSLPFSEVMANAGRGLLLLARSFGYVLVPVVLYGVVRLFQEKRALAAGLSASAVLSFGYAVNYSIPDIEAYYIPCAVSLAVFGAAGLAGLARRLGRWRHLAWIAAGLVLALNFRDADRRRDYAAHDQAVAVLESVEPGGILLTDWWDIYAPVFYLQHVEGLRPDVCIIDKELVRRSWYVRYLGIEYPWLAAKSERETTQYLTLLDLFERRRPYDGEAIQAAYIALIESFVRNNPDRPAYATFLPGSSADASQLFRDRNWVPIGVVLALRADSLLPEFDYARLRPRPLARADRRTRLVFDRFTLFGKVRQEALLRAGRTDAAALVADWVRAVEPR